MKAITLLPALLLLAALPNPGVQAYGGGGGGGGSSCAEPEFYQIKPANNSTAPKLEAFSATLSANTDIATLDLQVNGVKMQPALTPQRNGDTLAELKIDPPIADPGRARITLRAKSREGCETFLPIYIDIKP